VHVLVFVNNISPFMILIISGEEQV